MMQPAIRLDDTIEQLLRLYPVAARVLVRRGMACVGCLMAPFDSIAAAAAAYGQDPGGLLAELRAAAGDRR